MHRTLFYNFRTFLNYKMKAVLIVLAIAVAVSANPINRKWEEIRDLLQGMGGDVDNAVAEIKLATYCQACNPQIGQQIEAYLDKGIIEAFFIFAKINADIGHQTLTYQQAKEYFSQLETLLNKVKDDLRDLVFQLPQEVQTRIKNILDNNTEEILQKQEKILDLLTLKQLTASVKKWDEINKHFTGIGSTVASLFIGVTWIAAEANQEVGQQVAVYFEGKGPEVNAIYEKIDGEIAAQTLTYDLAVTYFTQFGNVLSEINDDLTNLVSELPLVFQNQIKHVLKDSNRQFNQQVDQILTLLNSS